MVKMINHRQRVLGPGVPVTGLLLKVAILSNKSQQIKHIRKQSTLKRRMQTCQTNTHIIKQNHTWQF